MKVDSLHKLLIHELKDLFTEDGSRRVFRFWNVEVTAMPETLPEER